MCVRHVTRSVKYGSRIRGCNRCTGIPKMAQTVVTYQYQYAFFCKLKIPYFQFDVDSVFADVIAVISQFVIM
jgi:uncharacterized membrane protein